MPDRRISLALATIVVLAAALRLATLDTQSLWLDETVTAGLVRRDLGDLFSAIYHGESTPPLYYVLAWAWTHVFGDGAVGLRSLSAVLGTATVALVAALGGRVAGARGALLAGALAAVNPLLVWYAQEARSYALLVPLAALSVLLLLRALQRPTRGRLLAWGAVAALALATHYFAAFLVVGEAAWLLWRRPGPAAALTALAAPVAMAVALAPLALHQRANDTAGFIRTAGLPTRTAQVPKQWLIGYDAPHEALVAGLAALLVLVGLWGLAGRRLDRRAATALAAIAVAAVVLPLALAVLGEDDFLTRNVTGALGLALALLGAGFAALRRPRAGLVAAAALCALWAAVDLAVASDPALQRDDWRGATAALGAPAVARVVVVTPGSGRVPAEYYLAGSAELARPGAAVTEIDLVGLARRAPGQRPMPPRPADVPPPAPGFTAAGRIEKPTYTVVRFRALRPLPVTPDALAAHTLDGSAPVVLLQPARR